MDARKRLMARIALVGAGLAALGAGLFVGTTGCCGPVEPIEDGTYEVVRSPERPELLGATVEIRNDRFEISFTDADANMWVVRYAITEREG